MFGRLSVRRGTWSPFRSAGDRTLGLQQALSLTPNHSGLLSSAPFPRWISTDMMELNPIRQRIAELIARLDALRGFL